MLFRSKEFGGVDILVNNAGRTWGTPLGQFPYKAWESVLSLNVTGMFMLTQELLPMLKAAGTVDDPSRVINLGSVMGSQQETTTGSAWLYRVSKAALNMVVRCVQADSADVTVLALHPVVSLMALCAMRLLYRALYEHMRARISHREGHGQPPVALGLTDRLNRGRQHVPIGRIRDGRAEVLRHRQHRVERNLRVADVDAHKRRAGLAMSSERTEPRRIWSHRQTHVVVPDEQVAHGVSVPEESARAV